MGGVGWGRLGGVAAGGGGIGGVGAVSVGLGIGVGRGRSRGFRVGVGSSVGRHLLWGRSRVGRGEGVVFACVTVVAGAGV